MSTSILPIPQNQPHADSVLSDVDAQPEEASESEQSISSSAYLADLNYKIKWFGLFALEDDFWWDFWLLVRYQKAQFLEDRGEVYSWDDDDGDGEDTEDTTSSLERYLAEGEEYEGENLDEEGGEEEGVYEYLRDTIQPISSEERLGRIEVWLNTQGHATDSLSAADQVERRTTQGHIGPSETITRKRILAQVEQANTEYERPFNLKIRRIESSREERLGRIQSWLNTIGPAQTFPAAGCHIEQQSNHERIQPIGPISRKRTLDQVEQPDTDTEHEGPSNLKFSRV